MLRDLGPDHEYSLITCIAEGDPAACGELYCLLQEGVRFYLLRRGAADRVDDLVHEVFVRALTAIRTSRPQRLVPYVLGIAKRVASESLADVMNSRLNRPLLSQDAVADRTPELLRREQERRDLLLAALRELSARDQELLMRFYVRDQAPAEICGAMNLTLDQFRIIKSRAKQRLTNKLNRTLSRTEVTIMARFKQTLSGRP